MGRTTARRQAKGIEASFIADFETVTDPEDCRVWAWCIAPVKEKLIDDDFAYGNSIESFISELKSGNYPIVYFHNLGFDGDFIISYLLNNGYAVSKDSIPPYTMNCLISNMGKYYSIKVNFNGNLVEFRDSLKKIPLSVSNMAKAFALKDEKLSIDYDEYRKPGHELSVEEIAYIKADVSIVSKSLFTMLSEGGDKLTIGSDSMAKYKEMHGDFRRTFPVLPLDTDNDIRQAYRGGWTYVNDRYAKQVVGPGKVFDVNSLYPYVMKTRKLPYGWPEWFDGEPDTNRLFTVSLTFTASLRKGFLPIIQLKNNPLFKSTEYLKVIEDPVTTSVTNVDLKLWSEHYDLDILSFNGGYYFSGAAGMFDDYIDHYMHIKETATGGLRAIAKLHLNSLYGKFASRPLVVGKYPILDDGVIRLVEGEMEEKEPIYTPVSVFVTAYAREITIRAAQSVGSRFIYADTDSIHMLGFNVPGIMDIHPTRLGAWKHEYDFEYGMFWRAKAYIERKPDGEYECHVAGMPTAISKNMRICDFYEGNVIQGKLAAKRVKGGTVLVDRPYRIA